MYKVLNVSLEHSAQENVNLKHRDFPCATTVVVADPGQSADSAQI